MKTITVKIIDKIGIHARPASKIVQTAGKFESNISFKTNDKTANAKSVINLMALGAKFDTEVQIIAEGSDEEKAIESLVSVMKEEKLI